MLKIFFIFIFFFISWKCFRKWVGQTHYCLSRLCLRLWACCINSPPLLLVNYWQVPTKSYWLPNEELPSGAHVGDCVAFLLTRETPLAPARHSAVGLCLSVIPAFQILAIVSSFHPEVKTWDPINYFRELAFSSVAPHLWNSLFEDLQMAPVTILTKALKIQLFKGFDVFCRSSVILLIFKLNLVNSLYWLQFTILG